MTFGGVLATEFLKLRRSKVTWLTFLVYLFLVAVGGVFMWMALNPGSAARFGLLGQKASFTMGGEPATWATYLTLIVEMGGLGGSFLCSFIAVYLFGREYAEGTAKNLLALPVPRSYFVIAKIIVAAVWFALLTLWLLPTTYLAGRVVGLAGFSWASYANASVRLLELAAMGVACSTLAAWVAVETRGYLASLGYVVFTLMLASIFGHTGWGPWVPWSIVGIASGAAGPSAVLTSGSYVVIACTFLLGAALTLRHEVVADNSQ